MNIVSSADDGYVPHFAAMLHSVWLYNRNANFYLLDTGISQENILLLERFAEELSVPLTIFHVKDRLAAIGGVVNHPVYARLLIPDFLEVERVLYMDGDITVIGDLSELYRTKLDEFAFAARPDGSEYAFKFEGEVTGAPFTQENYYNTGVMLMDLSRWRQERISERVLEFAQDFPKKLPAADQTALNYVVLANYQKVGQQWNCFRSHEMLEQPAPRILHYIFDKAWTRRDSPFWQLYRFHRNQTPWPISHSPKPRYGLLRRARFRIGAKLGNKRMRKQIEHFRIENLVENTIVKPAILRASRFLKT